MATTKTTTTSKKTPTTPRKKSSATKKKTDQEGIVTSMDKEQLVTGLKKTIQDMGKIPWIFLAPVITYVSSKYDSIPQSRRKQLEDIVKSSKEKGGSVLSKLKDWFMHRLDEVKEKVTTDTDKKPAPKKKVVKKKTTTTKAKTTTTKTKTESPPKKAPVKKKKTTA